MSVTIECPNCHKRYTVDASASGKTAVCAACGTRMQIPDLAASPVPPAPEPEPTPQPEPPPQAEAPGALATQMRANRALEGRICPVCQQPIALGQPVRNCELCGRTHHDECWRKHNGCGTRGCDNAPLPALGFAQGEAEPPPSLQPPGTKRCPHCGEPIAEAAVKCRHCQEYLPGHGPRRAGAKQGGNSGLAIGSLVCGILSLLCCMSIVAGPAAIVLGVMARREIDRSGGRLGGRGMALAGIIMGSIGAALGLLGIIAQIIAAAAQA